MLTIYRLSGRVYWPGENKWIKADLKSLSTGEAYNLTLEKLFLTLKFTKFNMIIFISNDL